MSDLDNRSESETLADAARPAQPDGRAARRAALCRLGPLAIVTPPAVLSLLVSTRASAESPPQDPPV